MSRNRTLFAILIPAVLAGGLFATTAVRADDDDDEMREAEQEARQAEREARQAAREAEQEARQAARDAARAGRQAQQDAMRAAKGQLKNAGQTAREQLEAAREQIRSSGLPKRLRDRLLAKLDRVAQAVDRHLDNAGSGDMDDFEEEMEAMGEEIEAEMETLGEDLENLGDELGKDFGHGDWNFNPFDDDASPPSPPSPPSAPIAPTPPTPPSVPRAAIGIDIDMSDLDIVIDVDDLSLDADQIDALDAIFDAEQQVVEPAREALAEVSEDLRVALEDPSIGDAEIARMVDAVSAEEARIRKAQILAWVKSRRLLDDQQRDQVRKAHVKSTKHKRRVR